MMEMFLIRQLRHNFSPSYRHIHMLNHCSGLPFNLRACSNRHRFSSSNPPSSPHRNRFQQCRNLMRSAFPLLAAYFRIRRWCLLSCRPLHQRLFLLHSQLTPRTSTFHMATAIKKAAPHRKRLALVVLTTVLIVEAVHRLRHRTSS